MSWMRRILHNSKNESRNQGAGEPEPTGLDPNRSGVTVTGDNPIQRPEDDALGRAGAARSFAQHVLSLDAREGVVVGVLGAWGFGKTSFINLARGEFDRSGVPVLDFNPWMFSGAEQLVQSFFVELAAQLKVRPDLAAIGKGLEDYGEMFSGMAWLPLVGPWIERVRGVAKILGKMLQHRKEGVGGRRAKLRNALTGLSNPIVVVLDDIDRLSSPEIRDVFKLVRLTASFPNIIYIVAFDRVRVEEALAEQGVPGRDYLEKILQVTVDLPAVPDQVLNRQIFAAVDGVLANIQNPGPFLEQAWPDVFMEIIRPLIKNMRDVRRYAAAIYGTVRALSGAVALADVLALEAVRVFLPEVFRHFHGAIAGLTTASELTYANRDDPPQLKAHIDGLLEAAGRHDAVVRSIIMRLFPAAQRHVGGSHYGYEWKGRWLRERRVAHADILRLYLERVTGEGLQAFTDAERAWAYMAEADALDSFVRSLDPMRLQDVIASLEVFEDRFASEHVVPATTVLLNLLPDLPQRQRGMFELDTRLVVTRVTYRLVRSLKDPVAVEAAVCQVFPKLNALSSKLELINIVGHRAGVGHKLVSETAAAHLEEAWRDEVRSTPVHDLARERDLLRVLLTAKREANPSEDPLNIDASPHLTLTILNDARSEVMSQTIGDRAVRRSPRLAWEALIELYGDEATLKERIESLNATGLEGVGDVLELANKYLSGWRPNQFGDE